MCGFVGLLGPTEHDHPNLDEWSECIRHRGPDQHGSIRIDGFGIGTRRLSIQDLSKAGNQPMLSRRYVLSFNGEIYNHHDLRAELVSNGVSQFNSNSDTETILLGFETWGIEETLARLNGMYAIAVWDKLTSELSLVRDPLGIKPIFFTQQNCTLYFGSEVKALLPFSGKRISREGIALYLYFGFTPAPHSLVDGISKVRPGERVIFSSNLARRSETILPVAWKRPEPLAVTWDERVNQVRLEVERAVERQLISDVPVGVFLSGGIDSTIIASLAARAKSGLSSFSLNPESATLDPLAQKDAQLAASLASKLKLTHHEVSFNPLDLVEQLDGLLTQIDEPVAELYSLGEMVLSKRAREVGVPVVLTGHGGDEIFLGYPTYNAVFRGDLYNKIPFFGVAADLAARSSVVPESTRSNLLGASKIWRQPVLERYATVSGVHFNLADAATHSGISIARLQELVSNILDETRSLVCLLPNAEGSCNAELFARMDTLLMVPEHYNTRLDRMTMTASIEARVPLQDLQLIGFVSQLSHRDLLRGGLKGMLRHAFSDVLPEEINRRTKQTFQAPMLSWIAGPLASWVEEHNGTDNSGDYGATTLTVPRPQTTREAYQSWSLALLEGWRKAVGLER
jgi:asparagine synthase (glutamine-hydrolysing)